MQLASATCFFYIRSFIASLQKSSIDKYNYIENNIYRICALIYFQIITEYERVVIFRLGRLLPGGAKGPGIVSIKLYSCIALIQ